MVEKGDGRTARGAGGSKGRDKPRWWRRSLSFGAALIGVHTTTSVYGATVTSTFTPTASFTRWTDYLAWNNSTALAPPQVPNNGVAGNTYEVTLAGAVTVDATITVDRLTTGSALNGSMVGALTVLKQATLTAPILLGTNLTLAAGSTYTGQSLQFGVTALTIGGTGTSASSTLSGLAAGTNVGTLSVLAGGSLTFSQGQSISGNLAVENAGTMAFDQGFKNGNGSTSFTRVTNLAAGTMTYSTGIAVLNQFGGLFSTDGTFRMTGGTLQLLSPSSGTHRLSGTIDLQAGSTLQLTGAARVTVATLTGSGGTLYFNSNVDTVFADATDAAAGLKARFSKGVRADAPVRFRGPASLGDVTLTGVGGFTFDNATFEGTPKIQQSTVTIPAGGTAAGVSLTLDNGGRFLLDGTMTGSASVSPSGTTASTFEIGPTSVMTVGTSVLFGGASLPTAPQSTILNRGTVNLGTSTAHLVPSASWRVSNEGAIRITAGSAEFSGGMSSTGLIDLPGTLTANSGLTITQPAASTSTVGGTVVTGPGMSTSVGGGFLSVTRGRFAPTAATNAGHLTLTDLTVDTPVPLGGTVNLNGAITLAHPLTLTGQLGGASGLTLTGTGALTFAGAQTSAIALTSQAPVTIAPSGVVSGALAATLTGGATLTIDGTANRLTVDAASGAAVAHVDIHAGGRVAASGPDVVAFGTTTASASTGVVTNAGRIEATGGGVVKFVNGWSVQNSGVVRASDGSVGLLGAGWSNTGRVEVGPGGWVALAGGETADAVRGQIASGFAGGSWAGSGIAVGGVPAAGSAVGFGRAGSLLGISGTQTAQWHALTVDPSAVLLRYTLAGDASMDGTVDLDDLVALANHYGQASGAIWTDGDFDYNGAVDLDDLVALANRYGTGLAAEAVPADFAADWAAMSRAEGPVNVPEPGLAGMIGAAAIVLEGRARRRR